MLQTLYNNLGFVGGLFLAFFLFIFFVFWVAGLAGICLQKEDQKKKNFKIVAAVLFPVYPFVWMISEMIVQRSMLKRL